METLRNSIEFNVKACAHVLLSEVYHLVANFEKQNRAVESS